MPAEVKYWKSQESLPAAADGRHWGWSSLAPALRLISAAGVGPRPLDTATAGVAATQVRVAGLPAFLSDACTCYLAALRAACHGVTTLASTGQRGRPRQPRCEPQPELGYGPWVQQKQQGQLRTRSTRVVRGAERLAHLGCRSSPAWVERVNLTWRQALAPLARKTSSCCTDRERLRPRVIFFHAFSHAARPHMSVRQPWPLHERTRRGALGLRWRERTPAMAAGLTDQVWTLRELLTAKFEP